MWFFLTILLATAGFTAVVALDSPGPAIGLVVLAGLCLFRYLKIRTRS